MTSTSRPGVLRLATLGGVALLATWLRAAPQPAPTFVHTGTVDLGMDGITGLTVDPAGQRLYLGSRRGLLWVDLDDARVRGPLSTIRITGDVEFAPGLGKLFFAAQDAIGMVDMRRDPEPEPIGVVDRATDLVFEPTRRELYVFTSTPKVTIFDARSGEQGPTIDLPGWFGHNAIATAGRIFFNLGGQQGLFTIDIDTRRVSPWPVEGRLISPFRMRADPEGRYLFVAPPREIVVIDIAKAAVVARLSTVSTPSLAYDDGTGLLMASWYGTEPFLPLVGFRYADGRLVEVARAKVPAAGRPRLEPTRNGFVQLGRNTLGAPTLLLWRAR